MKDYIEITKEVTERVPLKRTPTKEELAEIKEGEFFDLADDLIDWNNSTLQDEDYSYCAVKIILSDKQIFERRGRY